MAVPQIGFMISIFLYIRIYCYNTDFGKRFGQYILLIYIGFIITLTLTSAITNTLKISFGSPRPSFFALCNYQGYQDAFTSGNYTNYFTSTQFGRYGDIKYCNATEADINDAFSSFPSGHSSLMFASILYTSLIMFMLNLEKIYMNNILFILKIIVSCGLFVLASWVTITRVMDYEHRTQDVLGGVFLGCIIGYTISRFIRDLLKNYYILTIDHNEKNEISI